MNKAFTRCRHAELVSASSRSMEGFTLIELLVVVLIIGILAAVAVPQYQKAVEKSRATQAIVAAKAIKDAEEIYFLANGEYTDTLAELDIDITLPSNFEMDLNGTTDYRVVISRKNSSTYRYDISFGFDKRHVYPGVAYCAAYSELAEILCKSYGKGEFLPGNSGVTRYRLN